MNQPTVLRCSSCQGSGEIGTENGPVACPDCFGEGRQLESLERTEWHLRDIERARSGAAQVSESDLRWLIFELRRSREALLQILSRCQDDEAGGFSAEVRFLANRALGLYEVEPES